MATTLAPDLWEGPFRAPRNSAAEVKGSIHDDATATKLGFKGGTVAGSIHMDQFVPRLLSLYGDRWWKDGSMSLYFTQATTDGEAVRCTVAGAEPSQLRMYNEAGDLICQGTANVGGPDGRSELAERYETQAAVEPSALRILKDLRVGDETADNPVEVGVEALDRSLETLTEPLELYRRERILPPSHLVRLAHITRPVVMAKAAQPHVGLFGALEVQHLAGPLKAGVAYRARTKIRKLSESPRTENVWYDVTFTDADGQDVGRVRYLLRVLKGSSPLYAG